MLLSILRIVIIALGIWLVWRLFSALFPARRSVRAPEDDEWSEILDEIQDLPETPDPKSQGKNRRRPRDP